MRGTGTITSLDPRVTGLRRQTAVRRAAEAQAFEDREKVAAMMLRCGVATGHGDTIDDLLDELEGAIANLQADLRE